MTRWPSTQNGQHLGKVFVSLTILTLTGFSPLVMTSGSFEIKLIKLNFPKQSRCTREVSHPNIKVSVCLSHHLLPPPRDPRCTLGNATRIGWHANSPAIEIPFSYTWSGRFTLSVRASCTCQAVNKSTNILLSQIVLAHSLNPSRSWTSVSTQSSDLTSTDTTETEVALSPPNAESKGIRERHQMSKLLSADEKNIKWTNGYDSEMGIIKIYEHSDRIDMPKMAGGNHPLLHITHAKKGKRRGKNGQRFSGGLWSHDPRPLARSVGDNDSHVIRDVKDSNSNDTFLAHKIGTMTLVLRVTCQQYYYGNGCVLYCKPRDDFVGHFSCSDDGIKICLPGWKGRGCTEAVCPSKCLPSRGRCTKPFTCECLPGWHGRYCEKCQTSRDCFKGHCHKPAQCLCQKGWTGPDCDKEIDYEQLLCQNGGTRLQNKTCLCTPSHTGMYCELTLCLRNMCLNNGTCLITSKKPYCKCHPPFGGSRCQYNYIDAISHKHLFQNNISCANLNCTPKHDVVYSPCANMTCLNNGICQVKNFTKEPFCKCVSFYTGSHCESLLDPCSKNPCKNRGKCVVVVNNITAISDNATVGSNVTEEDSLFTVKCKCVRGFVGKRCYTRRKHRENSKKRKCGLKCRKKKKLPYILDGTENFCQTGVVCQNGGTCIPASRRGSFSCQCKESWTGEFCEINEENPCASQVCLNGGKCRLKSNIPHCICPSGYIGHYCEKPASLCTRRTCRNGGICIESKRQFFCVCKRNYFGMYCEKTWYSQGIQMPFTVHISYSKSDSLRPSIEFIVIFCLFSIKIIFYLCSR